MQIKLFFFESSEFLQKPTILKLIWNNKLSYYDFALFGKGAIQENKGC